MTYDRFGELEAEPGAPGVDDQQQSEQELAAHKEKCSGWLDRNADQPKPCLRCRPHLAPEARRLRMGLGDKK